MYLLSRVGRKDGYRRKVGAVGGREGEKDIMVRTSFTPRLDIHSCRQQPLLDLAQHRTQHTTLLDSTRVHAKFFNVLYQNRNKVWELFRERECAKIQK